MHVVVEKHIDDLMTSATLDGAKVVLEIPNKQQTDLIYTTVQSNSAAWAVNTGNVDVNSIVIASSASWNDTYTTVQSNSSAWFVTVKAISAISHQIDSSDINKLLRFTASGSKTVTIPLDLVAEINSMVTLRNANDGVLTINPENLSVTINVEAGGNIVDWNTTAQMLLVAPNVWDIL